MFAARAGTPDGAGETVAGAARPAACRSMRIAPISLLVNTESMKLRVLSISIVCLAVLLAAPLPAQEHDHGHDHMGILFVKQQDGVQKKMVDLAEAIPADKYDWRPGAGVM